MKEKIDETSNNKSESTKSSKQIAVNNKCKNFNIVEQKDDPAASQVLDTVIETLKQLTINPESEQNGILRSNPKDNYLFSDKLKQLCNGAPAEIANSEQDKCITSNEKEAENGAIVNSQNGFLENQKANGSLKSIMSASHVLETSNGMCLLGSTRTILKESVLSKVLEDRKQISSTGNIMSSDIFHFTAPPRLYSKPKFSKFRTPRNASQTMSLAIVKQTGTSAASTLGFGDNNIQVSLTSSVSEMVTQSPIVISSKSEITTVAQSLTCQASIQNVSQNQTQSTLGTPTQLAKGGAVTTSVYSSVVSPILNTPAVSSEVNTTKPSFNSPQPNVIDVKCKITPTIESKATTIMSHTCENKGNVFNKAALMSMFDGSRNLFRTNMVQTPMSTDTKPQASFPFRNKYAASFELLSKRSLCSQKELQEKARIANPKFEMTIPTFCKAFRNVTPIYVFGGQEAITSMFDQMSKSLNIFKTPPVMKTNTLNRSETSTLRFTIGASPSVYSGKSPAQQNMTRPTNRLQNYKINLYKYEDYKRALAMFEEAIKLCPDNYTFYFIRAQYYMKLGMYKEAVKDVQKVIKYDSSFIDGYICLAKCCIALGDISAADVAVNKAREVGGNAEGERAIEAMRELRSRYSDTQHAIAAGDYARAVTSADSFLEMCPSNYAKATKAKCLAMLGRTKQALDIAEECLRNHAAEPEALYAKGLCLYYSCKLHQAVDYFQQVISVFPLHLGAIDSLQKANRLECLAKESKQAYDQGDYQKVIALNNEAMTVDKMNKEYNVKLYCNNAVMYSKLNKTHLAVKSCSDALRLNEKSVVVLKNRAKCYTRLGQYEDAVRDCEKVYQIDKSVENEELLNEAKALVQDKENAYREMASSVERLVRDKKFKEALKLADKCLKIRSSDTDVLYSKGLCFYYMDQYQEALDQYKQILLLEPSHSTALKESRKIARLISMMEKGDSAFISQRWQEALIYFNEALTMDEYNRNLNLRLYLKNAEIFEINNNKQSAIREYTKALKVDSNCSTALSHRAQCYSVLKQYEQAIEDYEKLYKIYKDEEVSEKLLIRNSIDRLKEKIAYRDKLKQADTLIASQTTESLNLALKIAEEFLKCDTILIRMDEPIHKEALCVKGLCLYYKHQYEQALDQFRQVLLFDPLHPKALKETKKIAKLKSTIDKGDSAFISQRWQDALGYFNDALTIDEYNRNLKLTLYSKKAKIYVILNDKQSAIKEYTKALEVDSNCSNALSHRAQCYSDVKQYEQAIEDYEKLYTIYKDEEVSEKLLIRNSIERLKEKIAYRTKLKQTDTLILSQTTENLNLALKIAEECLKYDNTDTKALCVKGLCLYSKDQYQEALDQYKQILLLEPSHSTALKESPKIARLISIMDKGDSAFKSQRWQDALDYFNEALTIDKYNRNLKLTLYSKKAKIYVILNDKQSAIKEYTKALEVDSNYSNALSYRAQCYSDVKQYEQAIEDYEKLHKIYKDEEVWGKLLIRNSIERLKEKIAYREKLKQADTLIASRTTESLKLALKLAEECLKYDSTDTKALCVKGLCLYYKDQYQEALDQYKQILLLEPSHSTALKESQKIARLISIMEKGDSAFISQRWQDALDYFKEALTIDEYNRNLKLTLYSKNAKIYVILNDKQSAIKEYTKALEVDSNYSNALSHRALCYSDVKQYEQAIEDYEKLYTIYKDEEVSEKLLIRNSIERLKEKIAYRDKLKQADTLLASRTTESLKLALKLAEECLKYDSTDTNALCVKGLCLYYKDQYQEALDQYKQILLLEPSHSTALKESQKIARLISIMEKGDSAFISRRWQDALGYFNKALTIDEYNRNLKLTLYFKKAEIYVKLNDKQSAIKEYTNALEVDSIFKVDSNCSNALSHRAQCYSDLKQYEQAIEDYEKLYKIYKDEEVSEKILIRNSIERLKEKIAYRDKLRQADTLIASRTTESLKLALKIAEECLKYDSTDTNALCVKGLCLYYKDQYEQALDQFSEVLLLEPSHAMALKESKKITKLKRIIDTGNDSFTRGQLQDALDKFNEALTIDGENKNLNVRLHCKKATTLKLISEQNIHAAIREYAMALVLDKNCVEALRGRAQCFSHVKQYEDAVKDYEMLYTIDQSEEVGQLLNDAKMAHKGQKYRFAQEKAEIGHKHFKRKKFRDALAMYKEAIRLDPETAEYYSNTYSCYMHLSMLKEALIDAKKAVALDAKSSKCFGGIVKCYLVLGELSGAERAITKASNAGYACTDDRRALETLKRLHAQAQKFIKEQNYDRAITCMDQCLQSSPFSSRVKLIKAECLAIRRKIDQALEIADDCIRLNKSDVDALFVKGLCLYYNEKHDQALKYFKEVLRLSPDHIKATATYKKTKLLQQKKEQGNEEFKMGRWQKALLLYNEALAVDQTHTKTNAKLHFNKATVYRKLNQTQLAADSCTAALELDPNYVKALTLRATCYTELEEYDCVIYDYEKLYKIDPSDDIKRLLDEAKRCQDKKSLRRNYYEILGLDRSATRSDIKRAYRQLSLMHHPDRHSGRSEFECKRQERRFKAVLEAYTVLSDPVQRRKYDARGHRAWKDDQ